MKPVIPPTTGRRVLVFLSTQPVGVTPYDTGKPYDGGIAFAWNESDPDKNHINVSYADHDGNMHSATSVMLHDRPQDAGDRHGHPDLGNYAVWVPYQFQQALRAAAPKRPPDAALVKLEENGELTDEGRERVARGWTRVEGGGWTAPPDGSLDSEGFVEADERQGAVSSAQHHST